MPLNRYYWQAKFQFAPDDEMLVQRFFYAESDEAARLRANELGKELHEKFIAMFVFAELKVLRHFPTTSLFVSLSL